MKRLLPSTFNGAFSVYHREFWNWVAAIKPAVRPPALVAIWPRGGGKSTSAETASMLIGATRLRRYAWYCSETQEQADRHLETISQIIENSYVSQEYPKFAQRQLGKYGQSRGWRRNRLRCGNGVTYDALGLDAARRGSKVLDARPDFIIFDDVDGKHDSLYVTRKKIEIITTSILPASSSDAAVLFIQNLIHPNSIAAQLADGRAEFLANHILSGPYAAVDDLVAEQGPDGRFRVLSGTPTWPEGQGLEVVQEQIDTWGLSAFLAEAQQEVDAPPGGVWDHVEFVHCEWENVPALVKGGVWVDPAITSGDGSDSMGIQADGLGVDGKIYRLFSWEAVTSPEDALSRAILKAVELGLDKVGVETDQGGDTWKSVYYRAIDELISAKKLKKGQPLPKFDSNKAASVGSKTQRNSQMLVDYEHGKVVHVIGTHAVLERALKRFPLTKPLDLADAAYWSWQDLRNRRRYGGIHL